jgi:hypothetical protein
VIKEFVIVVFEAVTVTSPHAAGLIPAEVP